MDFIEADLLDKIRQCETTGKSAKIYVVNLAEFNAAGMNLLVL